MYQLKIQKNPRYQSRTKINQNQPFSINQNPFSYYNPTKTPSKNSLKPRKKSFFFSNCREYCLSYFKTSSIHGFNHLTQHSRHYSEIVFWLVFVIIAMCTAIKLSSGTWRRYQENPTVISMERDRLAWNTTFPSITICPVNKYDEDNVNDFVEKFPTKNKHELHAFLIALSQAQLDRLDDIPDFFEIPSKGFFRIIDQIRFDFHPNVLELGASAQQLRLERVITEMGVCYMFNSKMAAYSHPEYWMKDRRDWVEGNDTVEVHPLDGEVHSSIVQLGTAFNLYFHGPYEVPDVSSKFISSPNGYLIKMLVTTLTLLTSPEAAALKIRQRKCRFPTESTLEYSPVVYSYTLCRIDCRVNLCKRLCDCVPHFYRPRAGDVVCDVKGLRCLNQHKEWIVTLKSPENVKEPCQCLANCNEVTYNAYNIELQKWFLGSSLQFGVKEYPRMRLKRDVLFGFKDVLVYVGGMAGLFLGCSVLSFIEVIYFFTLRLFVTTWRGCTSRKRKW